MNKKEKWGKAEIERAVKRAAAWFRKYYFYEPIYGMDEEERIRKMVEMIHKQGQINEIKSEDWKYEALTGIKVGVYLAKVKEHYEEMCNFSGE